MFGFVSGQGSCKRLSNLWVVVYFGRLFDDRLRMCGICLGVGDALLLVAACLVLGGDLLAQFALARCSGGFCGLQLVARDIGLCRHGLMGSLGVGDGGLRLLDGLLGCGKRMLKVGGHAWNVFLGLAQGIGGIGDLHRELAGAHGVIGGVCRRIALQLGILASQRFELCSRCVGSLLCGGEACVALGLHLVANALGIFESTNQAVAGFA